MLVMAWAIYEAQVEANRSVVRLFKEYVDRVESNRITIRAYEGLKLEQEKQQATPTITPSPWITPTPSENVKK